MISGLVLWVLVVCWLCLCVMCLDDKTCPDALGHFAVLARLLPMGKWQNLSRVAIDAIDWSGQNRQWCSLCHCHSPMAWKFKARINPLVGRLMEAVDSHKWLTFSSKFVPLIRLTDSGRYYLESCIHQSCANTARDCHGDEALRVFHKSWNVNKVNYTTVSGRCSTGIIF